MHAPAIRAHARVALLALPCCFACTAHVLALSYTLFHFFFVFGATRPSLLRARPLTLHKHLQCLIKQVLTHSTRPVVALGLSSTRNSFSTSLSKACCS